MLMTKGLDSKILYSLLIVSGFVLTIGAASAVVMYSENIELDNGAGDSSIKVTSSTGDSKIILEDQGKRTWSIMTADDTKKLQIKDETKNKPRITIKPSGNVGIGTAGPSELLDVNGNVRIRNDANIAGDLNVDGILTGAYIATLEATILDLQARLAALETLIQDSHDPMLSSHSTLIEDNSNSIDANEEMIAANTEALETGGGGGPVCDTDSDGAITAQELYDFMILNEFPGTFTVPNLQILIDGTENNVENNPADNGVLDTFDEVIAWNIQYFIPNAHPQCEVP